MGSVSDADRGSTMDYYAVEMGEGLAGEYTTVGAVTTAMYTCMGILFLNDSSRWGGLYHYPMGRLGNPYVNPTIISMYNQLKAERVLVTPAKAVAGMGVLQRGISTMSWNSSRAWAMRGSSSRGE